jgi:phosphate transport system protein
MVQMNEELQTLKNDIINMWSLVINQINKSREIVETFDKNLAREIKANEKRIDGFELKIDMECERVLALFNPVANDLRFVMSVLKINYNLERIGDYAYKIAKCIISMDKPFSEKAIEKTKLFELFNINLSMLSIAFKSFDLEDNKLAIGIFKADEAIDKVNKELNDIISGLIKEDNENI